MLTMVIFTLFTNLLLILVIRAWVYSNKIHYSSAKYLCLVFISFSLQMLEFLFVNMQVYHKHPALLMIFDPFILMFPFFISNYLLLINGIELPKVSKIFALHFVIPFIYFVTTIPYIMEDPTYKAWFFENILRREETVFTPKVDWPWLLMSRSQQLLLMGSSTLIYWYRTRSLLPKPRNKTNDLQRYTRYWLNSLFAIGLIIVCQCLFGYTKFTNILMTLLMLGYLWSLCYYFMTYLKHPKPPTRKDMKITRPPQTDLIQDSFNQKDEQLILIFECLKETLEAGLYKSKDLSLRNLSDKVGFRIQLCSKAINDIYGGSFYDWVNAYRVEEATRLLTGKNANISIICHEVGFNSKSTFYSAFKKIEGVTPGQFIKSK
jgi:AraC-like DNA-binding protein